jgi:hypothetical protein
MPAARRRARTGALPAAAMALASTVAALLLVELVLAVTPMAVRIRPYRLRLHDPNLDEPYLEDGDDVPYTTRPGYAGRFVDGGRVTINEQGFRTDPSHGGPYARIDVLCLGDSFTFGYLVDDVETYPAQLSRLYEPSGRTVVNAGYYGGFSFDSAALRYGQTLARWHPRVVVYGVFPGNDIADLAVWTRTGPDGEPSRLRTRSQVVSEAGYSVPLARESRLFVGLSQIWSGWRHRADLAETDAQRWARAEAALRRFRAAAPAAESRLVFVFLREANAEYAQEMARRRHVSAATLLAGVESDVRRLQGLLDEAHVEWHDDGPLLEQLRRGLAAHSLPPLEGPLADARAGLERRAAAAGWQPGVLAASDEVHYSGLTNAYVASWVYRELASGPTR